MNGMFIDGSEYISMVDAARQSGYTLRTINRLARTGKIDAKPIGSTWIVAVNFAEKYRSVKPQRKPRAEAGRRREGKASGG